MKTQTTVPTLIAAVLITLLGLGAYALADGGYPLSGPDSRGWRNDGDGPSAGHGVYRGTTATDDRHVPAYGDPNAPMYRNHGPMMNTTRPGYDGTRMNRGRTMNPDGGGRNCSW